MTEMATSKVFIIVLSCVVSVYSRAGVGNPDNSFGDVVSRFVGINSAISNHGSGVSPDGHFFAPGVDFDSPSVFAPVFPGDGNAKPLFSIENGPVPNRLPQRFFGDREPRRFLLPPRLPPRLPSLMMAVIERLRSGSVREAPARLRSNSIVQLVSQLSRRPGNRGSAASMPFARFINPFVENNGKRYEPMSKGFPDIFLTDEDKDSCFAKIKRVFDEAYPKLPELVRDTNPVNVPVPRALKLPVGVLPNYVSLSDNGIIYVPYKISTSQAPIFVPMERKTRKLAYPAFPIYVPYVKLSADVPEQKLKYFSFIPFQPDKNRPPSQTCSLSSVLMPIYGNPREYLSVASYTLPALQERTARQVGTAPVAAALSAAKMASLSAAKMASPMLEEDSQKGTFPSFSPTDSHVYNLNPYTYFDNPFWFGSDLSYRFF